MNKTSLKLGGNKHSDELQLMAEKLEVNSFCCEFNVIDNFLDGKSNISYSN